MLTRRLVTGLALAVLAAPALAQQPKPAAPPETFTRTDDVIYGRKHGMALTLDVFAPKAKANGRGVVLCVSGGWYSGKDMLDGVYRPVFVRPLVERGYTVFAVLHGSQPHFTIPEAAEDIDAGVKFVKAHAKGYAVDPDRLGVAGMSAGGHLSLLQGTATGGGQVAAVGCFFPPTDFLNYGKPGVSGAGEGILKDFAAPFDFRKFDPAKKMLVPVTGEERVALIKKISPANRVSKESAPALVIHGDADELVPIQQAKLMADKYKAAGVPFELVVKEGAKHGWGAMDKDAVRIVEWFDKLLGVGR